MTLSQVLESLAGLTFEERQLLIRRLMELDDPPLSEADEKLVESRLAVHDADLSSSLPVETLKKNLKSRRKQ